MATPLPSQVAGFLEGQNAARNQILGAMNGVRDAVLSLPFDAIQESLQVLIQQGKGLCEDMKKVSENTKITGLKNVWTLKQVQRIFQIYEKAMREAGPVPAKSFEEWSREQSDLRALLRQFEQEVKDAEEKRTTGPPTWLGDLKRAAQKGMPKPEFPEASNKARNTSVRPKVPVKPTTSGDKRPTFPPTLPSTTEGLIEGDEKDEKVPDTSRTWSDEEWKEWASKAENEKDKKVPDTSRTWSDEEWKEWASKTQPKTPETFDTVDNSTEPSNKRARVDVVCFRCGDGGHKAKQCETPLQDLTFENLGSLIFRGGQSRATPEGIQEAGDAKAELERRGRGLCMLVFDRNSGRNYDQFSKGQSL